MGDATLYSPVDFTLAIDGKNIDFTGVIQIDDNSLLGYLPGADIIQIGRAGLHEMLNGFVLEAVEIDLIDLAGTALTNERLPTSYNLADWPESGKNLVLREQGDDMPIFGRIDTITTVPVPASAWLFVSGLAGLTGFSRYGFATRAIASHS